MTDIHQQLKDRCPQYQMLNPGEDDAVHSVVRLAEIYGYGNLMAWLLTAWNLKLLPSMPHLNAGELPMPYVNQTSYQITFP